MIAADSLTQIGPRIPAIIYLNSPSNPTGSVYSPDEMRAIEPTLQGQYYGGYFTESDSTGDIHKFTHGLSLAAARLGVRTLYEIGRAHV